MFRLNCTVCLAAAFFAIVSPSVGFVLAQNNDSKATPAAKDPVWISSVKWLSDTELVGTQSQGLLLRPGKIVKANVDKPDQLTHVSESETSLWSILPLGEITLASDYKGRVLQWKSSTMASFDFKTRWIRCLAPVPGSNTAIIAGSEDGQLVVFDATSGSEIRRVQLESAAVFKLAFSPDKNQIAAAMGDGNIHLLSWPNLERAKSLKGNGANWCVLYSNDGTQLISGGADRKLRLWDIASGQSIVAITSAHEWITTLAPIPNSTAVIAGCMNGELLLADYSSKQPIRTEKVSSSGIWDMAISPDGTKIALGTRKDGIKVVALQPWIDQARQAASSAEADRPPQPQQ